MLLLILGKRDIAFPSLWAVFVSQHFREMNFVTALRDVGGSGERRSSGGSELPLGETLNPCQRQQEQVRKRAGRRQMGGSSRQLVNRDPEKDSGQILRSGDVCG